jgi:hypothetical protein
LSVSGWRSSCDRGGSDDQQSSQVAVTHLMKSACRVPIRTTSLKALTAPRVILAAVPFDHHHSRLPLHLIAAFRAPLSPPVFRWPLRPCSLLPSPTTPRPYALSCWRWQR